MKKRKNLIEKLLGILSSNYSEFSDSINSKYPVKVKGTPLLVWLKVKDGICEVDVKTDGGNFLGTHSVFCEGTPTEKDFEYCLLCAIKEMFKLEDDYDKREVTIRNNG